MRFCTPSVDPRSEDLCEPVKAILPAGLPPSPEKANATAAAEMCIVSVPWVMTTPAAPSANASAHALAIRFQCCGLMSSDHMFPSLRVRMRAWRASSGTAASSSSGSKRAVTAPVL